MTNSINAEQPKPIATDRKPAWELVITYCQDNWPAEDPTVRQILDDMAERDRIGRERYGVPLTSGNGRNHLVDAFQEQLDHVVYLAAWLDEHWFELRQDSHGEAPENAPRHDYGHLTLPRACCRKATLVHALFVNQTALLPMLRELMVS